MTWFLGHGSGGYGNSGGFGGFGGFGKIITFHIFWLDMICIFEVMIYFIPIYHIEAIRLVLIIKIKRHIVSHHRTLFQS